MAHVLTITRIPGQRKESAGESFDTKRMHNLVPRIIPIKAESLNDRWLTKFNVCVLIQRGKQLSKQYLYVKKGRNNYIGKINNETVKIK